MLGRDHDTCAKMLGIGGLQKRIGRGLGGTLAGAAIDINTRVAFEGRPEKLKHGRSDKALIVATAESDLVIDRLPAEANLRNGGITAGIERLVSTGDVKFEVVKPRNGLILAQNGNINLDKPGSGRTRTVWKRDSHIEAWS